MLVEQTGDYKQELMNIVITYARIHPYSVIIDHRVDCNHDFKWNEVEVLDNEF